MTEHCRECGSRICNHGNCPECNPCKHCNGGDRSDKFFGYDDERSGDKFDPRYNKPNEEFDPEFEP